MSARKFLLNLFLEFVILAGITIGFILEMGTDVVKGFSKRLRKDFACGNGTINPL